MASEAKQSRARKRLDCFVAEPCHRAALRADPFAPRNDEGKLLSPSRRNPAVDGEDHARGVAGAIGGKERHQVADLPRMRGPAAWHALLEFLVTVLVAELVFRAGLEQGDMAVGADRARIDADDANVVGEALSTQRA